MTCSDSIYTSARAACLGVILGVIALLLTCVTTFAADAIPLRLQLKWKHQFQFAGYYAAIEEGYFAAEGLNVEVLEGQPGLNPTAQVTSGAADFAVDSPAVLIQRQQGKGVVVLAAIFQHSPTVLLSADPAVRTPSDLLHRRVMLTPVTDPECVAMLLAAGMPLRAPNYIPHSWNIADLTSGATDAMSAYLTNEPYLLRKQGISARVLNPLEYGIDFYGDCLLTSEQMARQHPERVDAFMRAVRRGWHFALDHPEQLSRLIQTRYGSEKSFDHLLFEARIMRSLILPDLVEIGHMNPARWQHIADTYVRLGMMSPNVDLSGFLYAELREESHRSADRLWRNTLTAVGIMAGLGTLVAAALLYFNTRLARLVQERTSALAASERSFRAFFEMASVCVAQVDMATTSFRRVNRRMCEQFGYTAEEFRALTYRSLTHAEDLAISENAMRVLISGERQEFTLEKRYCRKDGSVFWGLVTVSPLWSPGEQPVSALVLLRDISHRKVAEEKLQLAAKVFQHSIEGIVITGTDGTIQQVNPGFTTITGYSAEEAVGKNPRILKSDRHPQVFYEEMWRQLLQEGQWSGEIWNRRKSGEAYPEWLTISAATNSIGETTHYISIFHDITELKAQQDQLAHQAQHDALTGLPNRVLFNDRLRMALAQMHRHRARLAILFLDLDNFKNVNDGLGHSAGDALLVELARRLAAQLREGDTLARLGGDEFLILLPDVDSANMAGMVADRLLGALAAPFQHGDVEYFTSASVGITVAPDDGNDPDKLVKNADMAMYRAKNLGRNNYQFFTQEMDIAAHRRISMESKLRRALEQEEFELHYQPLVQVRSGRILGAEALVRWRHGAELIPPGDFIPLAEESGIILPLGEWVLRTAAVQAKNWQEQGHDLAMSVNISARQFTGPNLANILRDVLSSTGLPPGSMYFEITESMLMGDMLKAEMLLFALRQAGGRFYLDDFGTGYSSLSYLKRLPIDGLKIDRSFVRDITDASDSRAIVEAVVSLARTLKLSIIAEGVETQQQRRLLYDLGVERLQGYLASRPVPADQFKAMLHRDSLLPPLSD